MSIKDKVNKYYLNMLYYQNNIDRWNQAQSLSSNNYPVKEKLKEIIESNNDYLLSNAYQYFLILRSVSTDRCRLSIGLYKLLGNILSDKEILVNDLISYIQFIKFNYHDYKYIGIDCYKARKNMSYMFNDFEKQVLDIFYDYYVRLNSDDDINPEQYLILKKILLIVSSLAIIEQDVSVFESMFMYYYQNIKEIEEVLILNGAVNRMESNIYYRPEEVINDPFLTQYILNIPINNKNKREIK